MTDANITSPIDVKYNCIAWAVHDTTNWWEPDPMNLQYWPPGVPRRYTIDAYINAYQTLGYEVCANADVEPGYQKIALYKNNFNWPTHASRQLSADRWTSKLGQSFDIDHPFFTVWDDLLLNPISLVANIGSGSVDDYGHLAVILKKKI